MYKLGLLGYGYWGPILTKCFYDAGNPISIIADRHYEKADKIKYLYPSTDFCASIEEVINDPEIKGVVVALPTFMHYEICKKALLAGKHVFVEKPLTDSLEQAEELTNLAKKSGLTLMVDHHFVYKKSIRRMEKLVHSGSIGKPHFFESTRANLGIFRNDVDVVWDLVPHDLSILKYILKKNPISVSAVGSQHIIPQKTDTAHINLFYENNFSAHIFVSWIIPQKIRDIYIGGEHGVIHYDDNKPENKLKICSVEYKQTSNQNIVCNKNEWTIDEPDTENAISTAVQEFIGCIKDKEKPLSDGFFSVEIIKTIEAIQKSIKQNGERVHIL